MPVDERGEGGDGVVDEGGQVAVGGVAVFVRVGRGGAGLLEQAVDREAGLGELEVVGRLGGAAVQVGAQGHLE